MGQVNNPFCVLILYGTLVSLNLLSNDTSLEFEKYLTEKMAHIANLTINITCNPNFNCNPQQNVQQNLSLMLPKISDIPLCEYSDHITSSLYDNRYKIAGITFAAGYLYIFYEVVKGNNYLGRNDTWAVWKQDLALVQLLEVPQKELTHELILEIQMRYTNREKPTDFVSSLIFFMRDIDQEISRTKYLIKLGSWLRSLRIFVIFPINKARFLQATDRLNRLTYLRSLFLNWTAHYKMEQNFHYTPEA